MSKLQASTKMKIPPNKLEEFKKEAEDYIRQVRDKHTGTLQCDWFLSTDMTECEIRETYESSEAALTHQSNLQDPVSIMKFIKNLGLKFKSKTIHIPLGPDYFPFWNTS